MGSKNKTIAGTGREMIVEVVVVVVVVVDGFFWPRWLPYGQVFL